ncbi:MAG: DUF222 domain-containing protein [Proteobacteria bacterium]|nr:DUF222 domain-containing protein [Pseudomonadota bacterium]
MTTALASIGPTTSPGREKSERLGAEISELCSYLYAAEHRLLTLIREFDAHKGWEWLGFHTCAHWLNFKCGIDMNTARERVRVAHALGKLAKMDARFASGALSYSKVRAMTRIADESNEDFLLMIARHGTAYHVEKLVSKFRRARRLQDTEVARENYDNRKLDYYYDYDGCLVIQGRFPAEQGALIIKALEMAMEQQFKTDVAAATSSKPAPIATRRADALAEVAETYMNSEPVANATADRYQVVVHVGGERNNGVLQSEDVDVSAETSRRIACDCSILGIKEAENGEPLSIGRKTRSIPPALHRALRFRDKGCRFPGCTNDRFVDGHHIQHWADGGATSLDNLVLLCRRHHHLVHEGGFACKKSKDGEIVFKDQRQAPLPTWSALPTIDDVDLKAWMDREFFEQNINSDTPAAQWYAGDRMDWDLAVASLFN